MALPKNLKNNGFEKENMSLLWQVSTFLQECPKIHFTMNFDVFKGLKGELTISLTFLSLYSRLDNLISCNDDFLVYSLLTVCWSMNSIFLVDLL